MEKLQENLNKLKEMDEQRWKEFEDRKITLERELVTFNSAVNEAIYRKKLHEKYIQIKLHLQGLESLITMCIKGQDKIRQVREEAEGIVEITDQILNNSHVNTTKNELKLWDEKKE